MVSASWPAVKFHVGPLELPNILVCSGAYPTMNLEQTGRGNSKLALSSVLSLGSSDLLDYPIHDYQELAKVIATASVENLIGDRWVIHSRLTNTPGIEFR